MMGGCQLARKQMSFFYNSVGAGGIKTFGIHVFAAFTTDVDLLPQSKSPTRRASDTRSGRGFLFSSPNLELNPHLKLQDTVIIGR